MGSTIFFLSLSLSSHPTPTLLPHRSLFGLFSLHTATPCSPPRAAAFWLSLAPSPPDPASSDPGLVPLPPSPPPVLLRAGERLPWPIHRARPAGRRVHAQQASGSELLRAPLCSTDVAAPPRNCAAPSDGAGHILLEVELHRVLKVELPGVAPPHRRRDADPTAKASADAAAGVGAGPVACTGADPVAALNGAGCSLLLWVIGMAYGPVPCRPCSGCPYQR